MIRILLGLIVSAATAQADPFCDALASLATTEDAGSLTLPETATAAICRTSIVLGGGRQVHCGTSFAYRAPAASQAFAQTITAVTNCLGPDSRVIQDQDVNHPDFYDLKTFTSQNQTITVSLKDKGALQQTLVFVSVSQR